MEHKNPLIANINDYVIKDLNNDLFVLSENMMENMIFPLSKIMREVMNG